MADTDKKKLTKVERLQAGGYVAPKLRKAKDAAAKGTKPQRRIAIVDKDGRVVGYRDLVDVTKKLAERAEIEFDVQPGSRPRRSRTRTRSWSGSRPRQGRRCGGPRRDA